MSVHILTGASALALLGMNALCAGAEQNPTIAADARLRTVSYDVDQIYRLRGYVGYELDLEFEPGETFVGLGAGDVEGLGVSAHENHLFIKPRAARVQTNLTVLTSRRAYHFEYRVLSPSVPTGNEPDLIFRMRFRYPDPPSVAAAAADGVERALARPSPASAINRDYWYCGNLGLLPQAAFDDGVHTHLRFDAGAELPAVFVRNDDGSESLLNFTMQDGEVVIHRVAARLILRRGRLEGCVVNKSFAGGGRDLHSGTITPAVERATRELPR